MPTAYIKSVAAKTGKSTKELEKIWSRAKAAASAQGKTDSYALITSIFKKMAKIESTEMFTDIDKWKDAVIAAGLSYHPDNENDPIRWYAFSSDSVAGEWNFGRGWLNLDGITEEIALNYKSSNLYLILNNTTNYCQLVHSGKKYWAVLNTEDWIAMTDRASDSKSSIEIKISEDDIRVKGIPGESGEVKFGVLDFITQSEIGESKSGLFSIKHDNLRDFAADLKLYHDYDLKVDELRNPPSPVSFIRKDGKVIAMYRHSDNIGFVHTAQGLGSEEAMLDENSKFSDIFILDEVQKDIQKIRHILEYEDPDDSNDLVRNPDTSGLSMGNYSLDTKSGLINVTINDTKYSYRPTDVDIYDLYKSVTGMARYSVGKSLAYLKKHAVGVRTEVMQ